MSSPIEVIRRSSGTGAIGERSANVAMIKRPDVKTRIQPTITEHNPGAGSNPDTLVCERPPPPSALKSAKLIGWGCGRAKWKSRNVKGTRKTKVNTGIFPVENASKTGRDGAISTAAFFVGVSCQTQKT